MAVMLALWMGDCLVYLLDTYMTSQNLNKFGLSVEIE